MQDIAEKPIVLSKLDEACRGLNTSNHTVSYFKPFTYDAITNGRPNIENMLSWAGYSTDESVEVLSLRHFLAPVTSQLPEYGIGEKTLALRYLKLQNSLEELLDTIRVFRIGEKKSEAIVIGKTSENNYAGLRIAHEHSLLF